MTTQTQHTPGKWYVQKQLDCAGNGLIQSENSSGNRTLVATIHCPEYGYSAPMDKAECKANANLITAAPDMLLEIEKQIAWLEHMKTDARVKLPEAYEMGLNKCIKYLSTVANKARGGLRWKNINTLT